MSLYEMRITWDTFDNIYVVEVPELPGCIAHGATRSEAIAMAEDAIAGWLKVAQEEGRPIPAPNVRTTA